MARTGSFGRRPRSSGGNLAALIAALLREQRAAQDRAIFDAYNNGGLFEGKAVTDGRLLEYIQQRRDGFSKDDPLWDQWNNSYIQQRFTIGEQKIALLYKQGKVKAGAVAAFYKGQLSSIPKDSAFYREVAGRAAEWAKAARQASGGGGGSGGGSGSSQKSLYKQYQEAGDALEAERATNLYIDYAIRAALARDGYAIPDNVPVLAAGADIITDLFNSGKVVGPQGVLSLAAYEQSAQSLDKAYGTAIEATKNAGYQYVHLIDARHDFQNETLTKIPSLPYQNRAEAIYSLLNTNLEAAQGSPEQIAKAYATAQSMLSAVASDAEKAGADLEVVAALKNDVLTLGGGTPKGPSLLDTLMAQNAATGQKPWRFFEPDEGVASASAQIAADTKTNLEAQRLVGSGKGYLVQDPKTGALTTVDAAIQPPGTLGQEYQSTIINIGGSPTQVYLNGTQVFANAQIDENGNIVPMGDPRLSPSGNNQPNALIGYQFTYKVNGATVTAWAVRDTETGQLTFTRSNPFLGETTKVGDALVVGPATLDGQPLGLDTYISATTLATGTPTLVLDAAAQQALVSTPERAYQLYQLGKLDAATLVNLLNPSGAPGTTPEQALAVRQAANAAPTKAARAGVAARADAAEQGRNVARSILDRLLQPKPSGSQWNLGDAPRIAPPAPVVWTPPVVPLGPPTSVPEGYGPPVPGQTVVPLAPAPVKPASPITMPTPLTASPAYVTRRTGDTLAAPIKASPTTTKITSGQYTGKTIPL